MRAEYIFPTALIVLNIGAAVLCAVNRDYQKAIYWAAAKYRIPQKPKPDLSYYSYGECPTCGAVFEDKPTNYCGNCGQVLDWSDKK